MARKKKPIKASPTKSFFVKMITRDISLEDCILDLIDNSIDGAWRSEGNLPTGLAEDVNLSKYRISIGLDENKFTISDNCGGMSLDNAAEYAFSFGRRDDSPHDNYSIGVYGIGMKRAVFKLGRNILIESTPVGEEGFKVPIDVEEWLARPSASWDFDLEDSSQNSENGVVISVSKLTPETKEAFRDSEFIQRLRQTIARDYSLHLNQELTIEVNGEKVAGWNITFESSSEFEPARLDYVDNTGGKPVTVEVIGGMSSTPPDSVEPSADGKKRSPFGWYIICNGRVVLAADKTEISGWGDTLPKWHTQYNGFIGLVMFSAENASDLPLTTTKRGIDLASAVFQEARSKIKEISQVWTKYTEARKIMKRIGEESEKEVDVLETATKPVRVYDIKPRESLSLPKFNPKIVEEQMANVTYSVPLSRAKALARAMKNENLCYRDIGLTSFEYAYNNLVKED